MESTDKKLVNRVANSRLKVINLENFFPKDEVIEFDLKDYLFKELILKEKDFRSSLSELDWNKYKDKTVAVFCSNDAIIPTWAFMLVASHLESYASRLFFGTKKALIEEDYRSFIENMDGTQYQDELIVIKGCSRLPVPTSAYVYLTAKLKPYARSIMFGEACSTVPIYKKSKKR